MDRQEIRVGGQHPDASRAGAVITVALPVPVETGTGGTAYQSPQDGQRIGEKRSARPQLIVAAFLVVVAERRKDRRTWKGLLEPLPEELHRLSHKDPVGGARMVGRGSIEFAAESMREKIAGQQNEIRLQQCLCHVSQRRAQQRPIAVPPVSTETAVAGAVENRAPLFRLGRGQLI